MGGGMMRPGMAWPGMDRANGGRGTSGPTTNRQQDDSRSNHRNSAIQPETKSDRSGGKQQDHYPHPSTRQNRDDPADQDGPTMHHGPRG